MADSSITKRALATALKELMQEMPFAKIHVSHICDKCSMNRQSFYYHFQDKFELMNWIFDMDFIELLNQAPSEQTLEGIMALCRILYDNRRFYRSALMVQGQNSLGGHIREIAKPILNERLKDALSGEDSTDFYCEFFLDAVLSAILRWITDANCEPPEAFIPHFFSCVLSTSKFILNKYSG